MATVVALYVKVRCRADWMRCASECERLAERTEHSEYFRETSRL